MPAAVTLYHNAACSTSRRTLDLLRQHGVEPRVVAYLHAPPTRDELRAIARAAGVPLRGLLRSKEPAYQALGLAAPDVDDDALLDAVAAHPELIERPIAVTPRGACVARPPEKVLALLADEG